MQYHTENDGLVNALKDVATAVTGSFDLDTLLQGIVETCTKFSNASRGALFLYDKAKGTLIMRAEKGYASGMRFNATYPKKDGDHSYEGEGLTPYIFNSRETLVLNSPKEITSHPAHQGKYDSQQYPGKEKCQSFIGIPLIDSDANIPIGVLKIENTIDRKPTRKFSDHEKEIFVLLSEIASMSISKFQKQLLKIGTSIDRLTKVLHGTDSLKVKLRNIAATFKDISHAEATSVWLKRNNGEKLVCEAGVGYFKNLEDTGSYSLKSINENDRIGLTAWIAVSGNTVNIKSNKELKSHPQHKGKFDDTNYPKPKIKICESFIGVPLKIGEETIGVIKADNRLPDTENRVYFSEEEAQIFSYLALITAIVVKNHQEFEKASFHDKQLIELYKIGTECSHINTPNEVYWHLLVGLTHEKGLKFNRAILFDVNDRAAPVLTGRMAIGPLDIKEGKSLQTDLNSGNVVLELDDCKLEYKNNNYKTPQSKLQAYIEDIEINLTERSEVYKKIIVPNVPTVRFINPTKLSKIFQEFLTKIGSIPFNHKIALFSFSDIDSQPILGLCDFVYSKPNTSKFILNVLDTFINQIALSIARLRLSTAEEASREKAWKEFSGTTAHRIGTETSCMSGAIDIVKRNLDKNNIEKVKEYLPNLDAALDRLIFAVKEYTELTKPPEFHRQKLDFGKLLDEAVQDINAEINDNILLQLDISDNIKFFYGDYDRLKYVIKEIIHNAIVELQDGGKIIIKANINDDTIEVSITDTGNGIKDEILDRIFERAYKSRRYGTGLGLWIVKEYIKDHEGTVKASNIQPHGACFSLTLPIKNNIISKRLLIVEDTEEQSNYIHEMINEDFPYMKIDIVRNENDAIRYLDDNKYHFVITDIKLDECGGKKDGGLDVLKHIQEKKYNIKSIVITAHYGMTITRKDGSEVPVLQQARELGAADCINRVDRKYLSKLRDAIYE